MGIEVKLSKIISKKTTYRELEFLSNDKNDLVRKKAIEKMTEILTSKRLARKLNNNTVQG